MAVAFFPHCHYYLWFGSRCTLSGSSVAREGCWDGTFSRSAPPHPLPFPSNTPLRYPSPLPPRAAWQQSSLFLPHFTPARRHAQPLVVARARFSWSRNGGRKKDGGTGGLANVLGSSLQRTTGLYLSDSLSSTFSLSDNPYLYLSW